jgi:hypothetical protein
MCANNNPLVEVFHRISRSLDNGRIACGIKGVKKRCSKLVKSAQPLEDLPQNGLSSPGLNLLVFDKSYSRL